VKVSRRKHQGLIQRVIVITKHLVGFHDLNVVYAGRRHDPRSNLGTCHAGRGRNLAVLRVSRFHPPGRPERKGKSSQEKENAKCSHSWYSTPLCADIKEMKEIRLAVFSLRARDRPVNLAVLWGIFFRDISAKLSLMRCSSCPATSVRIIDGCSIAAATCRQRSSRRSGLLQTTLFSLRA